jgi:hypothetical protein
MKKDIGRMMLFAGCLVLFTTCSTTDPAPVETSYIPPINGVSWTNVSDPNHTFDFVADPPNTNVTSGVFTGEEILNLVRSPLTGAFRNRNISITIERISGTVTFSGQFVSDTLIDFGTFRIRR